MTPYIIVGIFIWVIIAILFLKLLSYLDENHKKQPENTKIITPEKLALLESTCYNQDNHNVLTEITNLEEVATNVNFQNIYSSISKSKPRRNSGR